MKPVARRFPARVSCRGRIIITSCWIWDYVKNIASLIGKVSTQLSEPVQFLDVKFVRVGTYRRSSKNKRREGTAWSAGARIPRARQGSVMLYNNGKDRTAGNFGEDKLRFICVTSGTIRGLNARKSPGNASSQTCRSKCKGGWRVDV